MCRLAVRFHGSDHIWETDQTSSSVPCLQVKSSFCENETTVWLLSTLASSCTRLPVATEGGSNECDRKAASLALTWLSIPIPSNMESGLTSLLLKRHSMSLCLLQSQLSDTEFQDSPGGITVFMNPACPEIRIWSIKPGFALRDPPWIPLLFSNRNLYLLVLQSRGMDLVEILSFLFQLSFSTLGRVSAHLLVSSMLEAQWEGFGLCSFRIIQWRAWATPCWPSCSTYGSLDWSFRERWGIPQSTLVEPTHSNQSYVLDR